MAPSAAAAQVLADGLGIACENTAKWLHEYDRERANFTHSQLVIVDEATLASTPTLDQIAAIAAKAGAKVLLVGDWGATAIRRRGRCVRIADLGTRQHPTLLSQTCGRYQVSKVEAGQRSATGCLKGWAPSCVRGGANVYPACHAKSGLVKLPTRQLSKVRLSDRPGHGLSSRQP